jgi:hypothetical protein
MQQIFMQQIWNSCVQRIESSSGESKASDILCHLFVENELKRNELNYHYLAVTKVLRPEVRPRENRNAKVACERG